jgi:hypothetical protein
MVADRLRGISVSPAVGGDSVKLISAAEGGEDKRLLRSPSEALRVETRSSSSDADDIISSLTSMIDCFASVGGVGEITSTM